MSDKARWDAKYAAGEYAQRPHPSAYLATHAQTYALTNEGGGDAADLACGRGRNSWYLASLGFAVDAYDVSSVGLDLARQANYGYEDVPGRIAWHERDLLIDGVPTDRHYDLIVMIRFVALDILNVISDHLNPGGVVLVEEHMLHHGPETVVGPRSERFRIASGQLVSALEGLEVLDQFEGLVTDPDGEQAAVARIIARKAS